MCKWKYALITRYVANVIYINGNFLRGEMKFLLKKGDVMKEILHIILFEEAIRTFIPFFAHFVD